MIPECPLASKPYVDQRFTDFEQGFKFYKEYGRLCGFDVRRSTEKSDRLGNNIEVFRLF